MDVCGEAYIGDHRTRFLVESGGDCCTLHRLSYRSWLWEVIELNKLARIVVDPMYTHDRRLLGLLGLPGLPGPGTTGRLGNPALRG